MSAFALALALAAQATSPVASVPAKAPSAAQARAAIPAPAAAGRSRVRNWFGLAMAPNGEWFASTEPNAGKPGVALVVPRHRHRQGPAHDRARRRQDHHRPDGLAAR